MKTISLSSSCILLLCMCFTGTAIAQSARDTANDYGNMSLKDLLNVKIVSVSKSSELLFDAPLSASVLTRDEIRKSGCTSIMEALRLVPGIIVREQTNGNYDIQLRGVYTTPNALFDGSSATLLVMINNRPIFNYLKGSTFWETLPVDLNDIEKIEVVRGPAAALYGPNALTGVINIITRQPQKEGLYLVANSQQGSHQSFVNNASIGFRSKKWYAVASGNYQHRNRTQTSYFEYNRNQWINDPQYMISALFDTVSGFDKIFPKPWLAMEKYAGNFFINYKPGDKANYSLSAGSQHSFVQKVFSENGFTPYTSAESDTRYTDFKAVIGGITAQFSYIWGKQVPDHQEGNKYDFNTTDLMFEYNYTNGSFSLRPGLSYRSAVYDDTKYNNVAEHTGIFNARRDMSTKSAYLRSEYKFMENKLRLVAGAAVSDFSYPEKDHFSFEFAATYKLDKKHLFRAVYSKAPRSSAFYDTYIDQTAAAFPIGYQKKFTMRYEGNKNLELLTSQMLEVGYRGTLLPKLFVDAELFSVHTKNYSLATQTATYVQLIAGDTVVIVPLRPTNLPMSAMQHGVTLSFHWNSKKIQVKPFITIQKSMVEDYAPYANTPDADPGVLQNIPSQNNIYSGIGSKTTLKSAPAAFGGLMINYLVLPKLNVNANAYYYSNQTITHAFNMAFQDGVRGIDHISQKWLLNTIVSYEASDGLLLFVSGKNILNNKSREFFRTDKVPAMFFGGINYEF
jgi:iron complex outermembrane recepter protein